MQNIWLCVALFFHMVVTGWSYCFVDTITFHDFSVISWTIIIPMMIIIAINYYLLINKSSNKLSYLLTLCIYLKLGYYNEHGGLKIG